MKRTNKPSKKQVDAIICSDLHLSEQTPVCRTDDYVQAQIQKLNFISGLQQGYKCPVLCAGDVFDHWKPSPWLISFALKYLPDRMIAIPGQHDLPQHSLDLIEKSGFWALVEANKFRKFHFGVSFKCCCVPFGESVPDDYFKDNPKRIRQVLMLHQLTWQTIPFPGADAKGNAKRLLKANPDFDLIITGDNHQAFTEEYKGRLLINPGSMLRKSADQIDFKPRVYLWHASDNTCTPVYLPIEKNVVTREHIEVKRERQNRLDSFIELLQSEEFEIGLSFEENIKNTMNKTKVPEAIKQRVMEALENGK